MSFSDVRVQFFGLLLVALAPALTLLLRGVVWGADSFAYWSVSCSNSSVTPFIHSPNWFVWWLQNVINCNFGALVVWQFLAYFFLLLSIWQMGRRFFDSHQAWRLPVYVGCLTPLFFVEVLRFEHELFGVALAFVVLACVCLFLEQKHWFWLLLAIPLALFSVLLWFPSVLVLCIVPFLFKSSDKVQKIVFIALLLVLILYGWGYGLGSFNFDNIVAEELPLVGLIFVIHIIHFYKNVPTIGLKLYTILLLFIGTLKSKYMFIVTPLLLVGLLDKQLTKGISFKREVFGVKEIPILYVCGILLIGWCLMGLNMYPTQKDLTETQQAIDLARNQNIPLYNDWGDGWIITSLGYEAYYKSSPPQPDWNRLTKPYIAWTKQTLDCNKINKKTYYCK